MERTRNRGVKRLIAALGNSWSGFRLAFKSEEAFRQEVYLAILLVPVALFSGKQPVEIALLLSGLFAVLITEMLNSAIECAIDRISEDFHDLSKASKDIASAAVLLSLFYCLIVWIIIFFV
ncbi:diacylglycerol kinase [Sneathiella sp.]|uniref:diacylglycerol kinase n=1 Tax=Sneathiella sp. TaxID=1964365 RepID=UPI00356ABF3C